ncbi:MAG: GatB/YqeY domain-containing protein [Candidatus Paceibacterota bacterium]
MSLQKQIKDDLTNAMRAKESVRVSVLRNITSEITNELLRNSKTPQDDLPDEGVLNAIERLAKQRRESIKQYEENKRADAAEQEQQELAVLETYLPEKMSEDDVRAVVEKKIAELGASSASDTGKVMGAVMGELKGKADGDTVKSVVAELLSA